MSECKTLLPDDIIEDIRLRRLSLGCYQRVVRAQLGAGLRTWNRSGGNWRMAVTSGDGIMGLINFDSQMYYGGYKPGVIHLLLDLSVPSNRYQHLSKLVLRAALSREARLFLESKAKCRVTTLRTAVFSKYPESMKYRGLFDIQDRRGPDVKGRYKLTYEGRFTDISLQEHFRQWLLKEQQGQSTRGGSAASGTLSYHERGGGASPTSPLQLGPAQAEVEAVVNG